MIPPDTAATLQALRRGALSDVRSLTLRGLTEWPDEVLDLAESLEILDLSGGQLAALPSSVSRLRKLRVLFCSGNPFTRLPPVLGTLPSLTQIGFRGCGLREVPADALPVNLQWFTLTDNAVTALPDALGARPVRKLMVAGNRLAALPDGLADCQTLELLRVAANALPSLPIWLFALPRLAWLAYAGNPAEPAATDSPAVPAIPWGDLVLGDLLGEGASGRIHAARWRQGRLSHAVAVKLFKGAMTSDGLPRHEMEACLTAGTHEGLTGALGRLDGHPEGVAGLVMPLLPASWQVLAGPPSLATCTRDVYPASLSLRSEPVVRIATALAGATAHLHACGLLHGDLYAHNTLWDGTTGQAVLSDFGAASRLLPGRPGEALQRLETRAWGLLVRELIAHCADAATLPPHLLAIAAAAIQPDVSRRPTMAEVRADLLAMK